MAKAIVGDPSVDLAAKELAQAAVTQVNALVRFIRNSKKNRNLSKNTLLFVEKRVGLIENTVNLQFNQIKDNIKRWQDVRLQQSSKFRSASAAL